MDGAQHAVTTLILSLLLLKIYDVYIPIFAKVLLVFGAFVSSHTATIWNIPSFSPDMDLLISKKLGVNIHRRWYFHSYLLMIPIVWLANYYMELGNITVGVFLFGLNFGWNLHIIEDWIWSVIKHNKRYFSDWVIGTSILGVIVSLTGMCLVKPEYFSEYLVIYKVLYYTLYLGFVPRIISFF